MSQTFMDAKQVSCDFFNGMCDYQKVLRLTRNGYLPGKKLGKSYLYQARMVEDEGVKRYSIWRCRRTADVRRLFIWEEDL